MDSREGGNPFGPDQSQVRTGADSGDGIVRKARSFR